MTTAIASSPRRRLLAVIAPGDGPHLLAPTIAAYRSRRATPRVSLEDELTMCLTTLEEDPEHYQRAAASYGSADVLRRWFETREPNHE